MLWAHLRRKDVPPLQDHIPLLTKDSLPPLAPVDKTGISMRILLSDTQANFEKFGERVVKLSAGVEETKGKMDVIGRMWEDDREKLGGEMVELGALLLSLTS